jgi:predicted ATPase
MGFYGPYAPNKIPDFGKIYSGNIPPNSEKFLTYFLGKLNSVIQKTRNTQQVVEKFIASCNRYLNAADPTTDRHGASSLDGKVLKLDSASLDVSVWRSKPDREIPLDALSSGEKQMISLFARLYLYPKEKLVLIDEPELSLSIDWQRKILPDILNSNLCKQVIAITHSPFIFDNELDAFAKALRIEIADNGGFENA